MLAAILELGIFQLYTFDTSAVTAVPCLREKGFLIRLWCERPL